MPSTVIRTASLLLCCVPWHPAEAQDVPHFDVDATCRAAPALTPQDRSPYDGCRGASSLPTCLEMYQANASSDTPRRRARARE